MATYTKEQKESYKQEQQTKQRELLSTALDRLTTSDGWRQYLDSRAKFHKYSFNNTILIALQRPDATDVAGAKKWAAAFKRTLIEGEKEKAIAIFAPIMAPIKDSTGNPVKGDDGKAKMRVVFYKTVRVYDITQTEGDALPVEPVAYPLEGDSHQEQLYRLEGHFPEASDKTLPVNAQVYELTRLAVRYLLSQMSDKDLFIPWSSGVNRDIIVESAAYLACRQMGLDTSGMTVPYLMKIEAKDEKAKLSAVREFAKVIDTLSLKILEAVRV